MVLSLIETLGSSIYSTDPRSDKIRRMLERDFQINKWAMRDLQTFWRQVVAHHFLDLRAYILHMLEASPESLLKQLATPLSLLTKILRRLGLVFKPKLIDRATIPEIMQSAAPLMEGIR